ncbi:MAG: ATP-binding protein [Candidatus Marinarcus sp.]|uniref:ATP-binding protein n=1 Tax=Candidatus Marinarcus sp. TaxID=3100987 RepID=UPI003B00EE15
MFEANTLLAFGVTFGIVSMTIFYTMIRYIYTKELIYLTYSVMQICSFIFIIAYSKLFFNVPLIEEISLTFATLFAFAFAVGFYHGDFIPKMQSQTELLIHTFMLIFIILTSFYHYILFEYLPYTVIYFVLFISVAFNYKQGLKPTFIYVLGWSVFCLFLYFSDVKALYIQKGYVDIVLVAFAIEAVLFTMSVAYKYQEQRKENEDFLEQLFHQTRLAQSGQMIGNIAHQWRQPLNNLSYILINLKKAFETHTLDLTYFDKKVEQANAQLHFMSKTIDDFKEFYAPSKHKENFSVKEAIHRAITIIQADLQQKNIELELQFKTNEAVKIFGISNELTQIIINLVNNSKEALSTIQYPKIIITVDANSSDVIVRIADNAGGIKQLNKIFEPYYSTKKEGSGIGLSMVKTILEKSLNGKIEVKNEKEGAVFSLFFEKAI